MQRYIYAASSILPIIRSINPRSDPSFSASLANEFVEKVLHTILFATSENTEARRAGSSSLSLSLSPIIAFSSHVTNLFSFSQYIPSLNTIRRSHALTRITINSLRSYTHMYIHITYI